MPYPFGEMIETDPHRRPSQRARAQSFLELALVLPVLLIMLLGLVEVAIFIGRYLDVLDLTREVARQAAREERFDNPTAFFNDTFSYLTPPPTGLNSYIVIDPAVDDVVVSVFDLRGGGDWIMRNLTTTNENYKKNCAGNPARAQPHFTLGNVITVGSPPSNEGMVAVEVFYCHQLALNLPILSAFVPNPVQIHAFTIFPFPAIKYQD